jgi:conjugative relaxase-like TrwC/TraI family protein
MTAEPLGFSCPSLIHGLRCPTARVSGLSVQMLNLGKLVAGPGAGRYYVDTLAQGREDYYRGEDDACGEWLGDGAAMLRLSGSVGEREIVRLLEARDPGSGESLRTPLLTGAVAGFDLTFKAPKSVSVLYGVADSAVAREIGAAHDAAVAAAMSYLEREACCVRRGHGGTVAMPGRGFVAAAFRHRTSRAGDPLLHTHVVAGNVTQGRDGKWSAFDGRLLYRHAKTAGYLYQAVLRVELTERLHVRWNPVERGAADIAGMPRRVIDHFSRRRAEVLALMAERHEHSARSAQIAVLETRRRKVYDVPVERLQADWRARASEHGLDRAFVARLVGRGVEPAEPNVDTTALLEALTRDRSRFTRRDVLQAFAAAEPNGERVEVIERRVQEFLASPKIVAVAAERGEIEYSTRSLLKTEQRLLERATARVASGTAVASARAVDAAIARRPSLSDEQCSLAVALTRSGDGVEVVRAPAGTGKTYALGAAVEAWQRSDVPVLGCALSARAACELRDQTGVEATTIARLRLSFEQGVQLARGAVLLVDEAGMVGTRDLAVLADAASRAGAKLILVGDDRQLPEIEAGGAFRALGEALGARELREVRRQEQDWDREALAQLRDGDVEAFVRAYDARGRLVVAPDAEAARSAIVGDWWEAQASGASTLMIAHRRTDVRDLNDRARRRMRAAGRLGPDESSAGGRSFAVGDRVVMTRNDPRQGLVNGQRGEVIAIDGTGLAVHFAGGGTRHIASGYAEAGHLEYGYAITAHRAQGATVDRAFVLGSDELYREWGYTALSRHRQDSRFYVTGRREFLNEPATPLEAGPQASRRVVRLLTISRAKSLAFERSSWSHPERPHLVPARDPLDRILSGPERSRDLGLGL